MTAPPGPPDNLFARTHQDPPPAFYKRRRRGREKQMNPEAVADLACLLRSWLYEDLTAETCWSRIDKNNAGLLKNLREWAIRYEVSPQTLDKLYDRFHRAEDLRTIFWESMRGN